jgi:hypothetical protein
MVESIYQKKLKLDQYQLEVCRKLFDEECYLANLKKNGTKIEIGILPLEHFFIFGCENNINPCRWFSVEYYLTTYNDVKESKVNPFYHYIIIGEKEGRFAHENDNEIEILKRLQGLSCLTEEIKSWEKIENNNYILSLSEIENKLSEKCLSKIVLSVSHDNYLKNFGGIQICIKREADIFQDIDYCYFHIYPFQPLPILSNSNSNIFIVGLSVNSEFYGHTTLGVLSKLLMKEGRRLEAIILHSLIGFNLNLLIYFIKKFKLIKVIYWMHDYFLFCPSWTLMRNKIKFCDLPEIQSLTCDLCYYGKERKIHLLKINNFFSKLKIDFIFPSENTLVYFESKMEKNNYNINSLSVVSHYKVIKRSYEYRTNENEFIRIAFIGHPSFHKGWFDFLKLFHSCKLDSRFKFFHFGISELLVDDGLIYVPVNTVIDGEDAMIKQIKKNRIDFCFLWSLWPETFGITSMEALLGGSRIVTNKISGNIKDLAFNEEFGNVFDNTDDVIDWLQTISEDVELFKVLKFPSELVVEASLLSLELFENKKNFNVYD